MSCPRRTIKVAASKVLANIPAVIQEVVLGPPDPVVANPARPLCLIEEERGLDGTLVVVALGSSSQEAKEEHSLHHLEC